MRDKKSWHNRSSAVAKKYYGYTSEVVGRGDLNFYHHTGQLPGTSISVGEVSTDSYNGYSASRFWFKFPIEEDNFNIIRITGNDEYCRLGSAQSSKTTIHLGEFQTRYIMYGWIVRIVYFDVNVLIDFILPKIKPEKSMEEVTAEIISAAESKGWKAKLVGDNNLIDIRR